MGRVHGPSILLACLASAGVFACSAAPPPKTEPPAVRAQDHTERRQWRSKFDQNHPLAGVIYDASSEKVVEWPQLARAIASADVVLLGEQHDNADHHLLQAALLQDLLDARRRPAVAFEQLDVDDQPRVSSAIGTRLAAAERASAIAAAVAWKQSGWPPFDLYRPVFETALAAELPILAANLSRRHLRDAGHGSATATLGDRISPLGADGRAALEADIKESHCGHASAAMVETMIASQRRRDDAMASVLAGAIEKGAAASGTKASDSAVLIAGFGHVRKDYGVPVALESLLPGRRFVSVALLEVAPTAKEPADYVKRLHARRLPFDYVMFTPRVSNDDPCRKYKSELQKLKKKR